MLKLCCSNDSVHKNHWVLPHVLLWLVEFLSKCLNSHFSQKFALLSSWSSYSEISQRICAHFWKCQSSGQSITGHNSQGNVCSAFVHNSWIVALPGSSRSLTQTKIGIAFLNNRIACQSLPKWTNVRLYSCGRFSLWTQSWSFARMLLSDANGWCTVVRWAFRAKFWSFSKILLVKLFQVYIVKTAQFHLQKRLFNALNLRPKLAFVFLSRVSNNWNAESFEFNFEKPYQMIRLKSGHVNDSSKQGLKICPAVH